jgi:hypothetical protein
MLDAPGCVNHQIRALAAVASTVLFGLGPIEARAARPKGRETEDAAHRRHPAHGKRARRRTAGMQCPFAPESSENAEARHRDTPRRCRKANAKNGQEDRETTTAESTPKTPQPKGDNEAPGARNGNTDIW